MLLMYPDELLMSSPDLIGGNYQVFSIEILKAYPLKSKDSIKQENEDTLTT